MGNPQKALAYIELHEYLALEKASETRHEYLEGVIYAIQGEPTRGMAGGSQRHADLVRNLGFALHARLRDTACNTSMSDLRLRIEAANAVFYPDVLVNCDPTEPSASEVKTATLVAEVLSPSTQQFDRGVKLAAYQKLAGLRIIILMSTTEPLLWLATREDDASAWTGLEEVRGLDSVLALGALKLTIPLAELF
jgi:Uma2 family endonuclease